MRTLLLASAVTTGWAGVGHAQDRDWDPVPDAADACPDEAETYDGASDEDGCAEPGATSRLAATRDGIDVLERIRFEIEDAAIAPGSYATLDVLAAMLVAHPELGTIRVEGHMDPSTWREIEHRSRRIWLDRARGVVAYLVDRGVPAARLVADSSVTDAPICDPAAVRPGRRRACRHENDRIVVRFAR